MFEWLSALPLWFQIVFSVVAIAGVLYSVVNVLRISVFVIQKGLKFGLGKNHLVIGGSTEAQPSSPHATCPHKADVVVLLNESTKIQYEKYMLEHVSQIRDQMNYAEQKSDQIRGMLQTIYIRALEEHGIVKVVGSISFASYRLVLKEVQTEMLSKFRHSFRENHFDEMTEAAFSVFIQDKFQFFVSEGCELLNDLYFYEADLTREELYKKHQEALPKLKEMFTEIYQTARQISIDYKVKLYELDERLNKLVDKYI
jgi:hypothetical protein